ncbi:MAG TPA: metallophosphoesterase [Solirubrobacterales bacterium]|nr:metallophosphoesterase [Solirubrobacterales bacterium]
MRTAIVSDLHLGSTSGEDLLRDAGIRGAFLEELDGADRLVLLGDVVELRELPLATALELSRPFFEEIGEVMDGRRVVLVPGNHDHRLAEPLLAQQALEGEPLGLEQRTEPDGEATARIAAWLGGAELQIAYPGIWLRDDVYATHGHYMDCHLKLPRIECIAAAAVMRAFGPLPAAATPENYEGMLSPVYGLADGLTQAGLARSGIMRQKRPSERAWRTMSGRHHANGRARRIALRGFVRAGVPAVVWSLNRLLRADFDADISADAISRSGIAAADELARNLGLSAVQTITGHTHRGGPEGDEAEWQLPGGGRLHNTGSWVFASAFHRPGTPPGRYWPGTITWLEDNGPPHRSRLLLDHPHDQLRAAVAKIAAAIP